MLTKKELNNTSILLMDIFQTFKLRNPYLAM